MEKSKLNKFILAIYVVSFALIVGMDWLRYDLLIAIDNLGFNLVLGLALYGLAIAFLILTLGSIAIFIWKYKKNKVVAFLPIVLMLFALMYYAIVYCTNFYVEMDYKLNSDNRQKIVEMYEAGELKQINDYTYLVPYRLASHNKKVYIQSNEGITKAVFYANNGYKKSKVVIYCSAKDSSRIHDDFGRDPNYWEFENIEKVDDKWFVAELLN